ncbi:hypothetical protein ABZU94_10620 [Streptomyces mirabilis]|uniref:hypothetical protein n=1 Tax=Streptomyces sp. NPDC005388 TaxID=3156717 RepID=UPI0033A88429
MKLLVVTIEPVQEIAAEQGTLDVLTASLRAKLAERLEGPVATGQLGSVFGWPLVVDPALTPGFVHLRPHPRSAEIDQHTPEYDTHD